MTRPPISTYIAIALAIVLTLAPSSRGEDASVKASVPGAREPAGALTPDLLDDLRRSFEMDAETRVRHNAVTNNAINDLALNRAIVAGRDGHFSHKIDFKGVTNQKASGRCWLFAGLNTMRPKVIRDKKLPAFEFSVAYLQFWDKMEKSNLFLEYMIEMRETSFLDREWEDVHKWTLSDGGWWNFVVGLVEKYGVVPKDIMPETQSSDNTRAMNTVLERKLRADAVTIRKMHTDGATVDELRAFKKQCLRDVYRFLVINLGEPPTKFEWRYVAKGKDDDKKGEEDAGEKLGRPSQVGRPSSQVGRPSRPSGIAHDGRDARPTAEDVGRPSSQVVRPSRPSGIAHDGRDARPTAGDAHPTRKELPLSIVEDLTPPVTYTPKSFYDEFVGVPLREYVCLYNDPLGGYHKHYRFRRSTNMFGRDDMHFVNLPIDDLKTIAMKSIVANDPVWFAADVGKDQSSDLGVMAHRLYDYDPLFGLDTQVSKADRLKLRDGGSNHAMVFMGVDIRDGRPVKWLVENSWGEQRGDRGVWTLYNDWFDEHVYTIIVHQQHVPEDVLKVFEQDATELPPWYPGAPGVR